MSVRFVFEIAGDRLIERELLRFGERTLNASPVFESIADFMMGEEREQFDTEGAYASGGWQPLKEETLRRKAQLELDPRILHATLALERSLTERGDPNQVLEVSADGLVFGSSRPGAAAHQNPRPGSRLPRRRPIEFTEPARQETVRRLQRWMITGELA